MLVLLIAALVLLAAAPPATAGDRVLVVKGDRIEERWDPYVPPDAQPLVPDPPSPDAHTAVGAIKRAVVRALDNGRISERQYDRFTGILGDAQAVFDQRKVGERCRKQVGRVLGVMTTIATRGNLTSSRMPALFLQLQRNVEFWSQEPDVRIGERVTFDDDPLLFQHYAGYGIQIQPLGSFGKANGLWTECEEEPRSCKRETLNALLESMLRIASNRAGFTAWEYWFPFGGGYPPWASGMATATGMQALARGANLFGEPRFMIAARKALPIFHRRPPVGVRVRAHHGYHYLLYSFAPGLRVLNAFLQAVTGLYDYWKLSDDGRARRLFHKGDRAARRETPRYDTGSWSYYALPNKNLSTWSYHVLVTGFLENLCARIGARVYCRTARRFARYSEEHGGPPPPGEPGPGRRCGYL